MTVSEWITETKQALERRGTSILYDSEIEKIRSWQSTGWIARNYDSAVEIANIQIAFTALLLNHALAVAEQREQLQVIVHRLDGEG